MLQAVIVDQNCPKAAEECMRVFAACNQIQTGHLMKACMMPEMSTWFCCHASIAQEMESLCKDSVWT